MGLTDKDILSICEREFSRGRIAAEEVRDSQNKALNQYFLRPNGKEREGYSQAQSTETRDAIEAMLPIVMDMYLQPESPVVFKPKNVKDMPQAMQETALVNHVVFTQNDGGMLFQRWFKDALLLKNGYVKVFWDDAVEDRIEKYRDLTADEYEAVMGSLEDRDEIIKLAEEIDAETGQSKFSMQIRVLKGDPQCRIVPVPSSRVIVSAEHNEVTLKNARYCCHYELRAKSDLIVDGYKRKDVEDITTATPEDAEGLDLGYIGDAGAMAPDTGTDTSRELVIVYEHYIRADKNGDGKAELLRVVSAGSSTGGTLLEIEECDFIPIIAATPFVNPHSHYGLSLADFTQQFQDVGTHLLRQTLDNVNLSNNPMLYVDKGMIQDASQVAKMRLGGVVVGSGQGMPVQAISVPFTAQQSYAIIQDLKDRVERSTGLNEAATGLNSEALAQSTNLVGAMVLNQAQLRARLVASTLADGVKELVLRVREILMKHMEREELVEISGQYVPTNPRTWARDRATQARIGLGAVQKAERVGVLQQIMQLQKEIFAAQQGLNGPMLTYDNVYNTLMDLQSLAGAHGSDRYFSNPKPMLEAQAQQPQKEQPIDTALELEAAKVALNAQKDAAEIEIKKRQLALDEQKLQLQRQEATVRAVQNERRNVKERFGMNG